jgi:predicted lipid carrier protein YhbT
MGCLIDAQPLQPLRGKTLELRVTDAGVRVRLRFTGQVFLPVFDARPADVIIGASAFDFLLLARRQADPDSLFFNRRLIMEGDTELGLLIKNTLDAVDFGAVLRRLVPPIVLTLRESAARRART